MWFEPPLAGYLVEQFGDPDAVRRVQQFVDRVPVQQLDRHAQNALGRGAEIPQDAAGIRDQDHVRGVLDQGAEVRLAALTLHVLGQFGTFDRHRGLRGDRPERLDHLGRDGPRGEDQDAAQPGVERHADPDPARLAIELDRTPAVRCGRGEAEDRRRHRRVTAGGHLFKTVGTPEVQLSAGGRGLRQQPDRRVDDRGVELGAVPRRADLRGRRPQRPLPGHRFAVHRHHALQPGQHQPEQHHGEPCRGARIVHRAGDRLSQQDQWGQQAGGREQGQPGSRKFGGRCRGGQPDPGHRRVQCGGTPADVEDHPAQVHRAVRGPDPV